MPRGLFLAHPELTKRAASFLTSLLPPKPKRPGRPEVTKALTLLKKLGWLYQNERAAQRWARVHALGRDVLSSSVQ